MAKSTGKDKFDTVPESTGKSPDKNNIIDRLNERIVELEREVFGLRRILESSELDIEDDDLLMTDAEYICRSQIRKLRELADVDAFTEEEARIFEIIHKNLLRVKGIDLKDEIKRKNKKIDIDNLISIVKAVDE